MLSARIVSQCRVPTFIPTRMSPFWIDACDGQAARQDRLDVEPPAQLGRDRGDVLGRDRLGLDSQQPPDHVIGVGRGRGGHAGGDRADVQGHGRFGVAAADRHRRGWPGRTSSIPRSRSSGVRHGQLADADQLVAGFEPGGFGGASSLDFGNDDAPLGPMALFAGDQAVPGRGTAVVS